MMLAGNLVLPYCHAMKHYWHDGQWVPADRFVRPAPVFPAIHRDYMDPAAHPANGITTDSKSVFRAATKAAGMIEMGTDAPRERVHVPGQVVTKADIARSWEMVEQGYRPPPAVDVPELADVPVREYVA
jgi:hypothetical protein